MDKQLSLDTVQFLAIFPEEIWILISKHVADSADMENLWHSSPFLRQFSTLNPVQFLFPKVFKILTNNFQRKLSEASENFRGSQLKNNVTRCRVCRTPRVSFYLSDSEILSLRLVSRSWCKAIDNFYEELPYPFKLNKSDVFHRSCKLKKYDNFGPSLIAGQKHEKFLQYFEQTHTNKNPFLGRRVKILYQNWHPQQLIAAISTLLKKYGHHIWYFSITFVKEAFKGLDNILKMEFLELLPNVKTLEIQIVPGPVSNRLTLEELTQLKENIKLKSLPEKLEQLATKYLYVPVFNELLSKNKQLQLLDVNRIELHENYEFYTMSLSNLKYLNTQFYSEGDFEKIENPLFNPPLKHLEIEFNTFIEWSKIFRLLENKWQNTLVCLNLKLQENITSVLANVMKDCASYRLNLPNLKVLKLTINILSSLDFILSMKDSLEVLVVYVNYEDVEIEKCENQVQVAEKKELYTKIKSKQIIQFLGWKGENLESNIWRIFPKLKQIKFTDSRHRKNRCTRAQRNALYPESENDVLK